MRIHLGEEGVSRLLCPFDEMGSKFSLPKKIALCVGFLTELGEDEMYLGNTETCEIPENATGLNRAWETEDKTER